MNLLTAKKISIAAGRVGWSCSASSIVRVMAAAVTSAVRWEFSTRDVVNSTGLNHAVVGQSLTALKLAGAVRRLSQGFYKLVPQSEWSIKSEREMAHGTK